MRPSIIVHARTLHASVHVSNKPPYVHPISDFVLDVLQGERIAQRTDAEMRENGTFLHRISSGTIRSRIYLEYRRILDVLSREPVLTRILTGRSTSKRKKLICYQWSVGRC
jgi:hypothetical protein